MNIRIKTITAFQLCTVAILLCSCSEDDGSIVPSQRDIETKIIGKWKKIEIDGKPLITNNRIVNTFNPDGTGTVSSNFSMLQNGEVTWLNKDEYNYKVQGNDLVEQHKDGVYYRTVVAISDNEKKVGPIKLCLNKGQEIMINESHRHVKIRVDYSQDIIGTWEGISMTGPETYGNAEARIEYKTDGTYTYYVKEGNNWVPSNSVDNEYNVDGDWLATRWRPEAGADFNYEWWDIDYIRDGEMKWSALREKEDGTCFTTTFTWKKME